ncbi:MAG TPA: DUF4214 domain-containing protein, partial [Acidobacteriaceae bacterium]|nr:DUF4214 domain-containing protein [Acidobacteriaceae bacterium]
PASVSAELATLTLDEVVAGPDDIAVEVFGNSGLVAEGTISVLATNPNGSLTYKSSAAGATPQAWKAATAQVDNGVVVQETITWNPGDGLNSGEMIGGATIMPIVQLAVDQPLLEKGLTTSGTVASLPPTILSWHSDWQLYDPLNPEGATSVETVPVTETASTLIFDPSTGCLEQEVDTLMAVPSSAYVGLFPFSSPDQPFYFASGGFAITSYDQPNNPYWSTTLYANGAGGIIGIPSDSTMVIADGSTTLMTVGSVETIYGTINGINKVVEVRYLGGANNPYDEVDQVFNPYSATPQLWQQIETVPIPSSMTGASPLTLPSATTVIEFNTGNNPDWSNSIWTNVGGHLQTLSVAGDAEVATTFENSNWDSEAEITAAGVAQVQRGVSWIGEGRILSAYNLPTPIITGWISSGAIIGTGIAGDWVVVTGSNGETLGGAEVGAGGSWAVSPSAAFTPYSNYGITVQQFDLAGDTSPVSAPVAFSDAPLVITGPVSCQQTTDEETVTPFAHVVVADSDLGQTETITVTLSQPANGMLTNLGTGSYDSATGVYMDIGTAAGVSAALNSLAFVPTPGEVAAGQTVTTQFTISVTDTAAFRTSDTTTSVVATAVTAPIGEVILSGSSSQYIIADDDGLLYIEDTVAGRDGTQILSGVTVMVFSNGKGLFDPTGNAEDVARLYGAALNRAPDLAGLEAWTEALDEANVPLSQVATDFTTSPEFISHYGSLSNAHFINQLYENVLGRSADAEGALFWNSVLASGSSRGTVLIGFAESEEYKAATSATAGDNDTAEAYRLYQAAFNRTPDPVGLAYWSSTLATSASPTQVAESFINSAEFLADHGNLSADDFVATLYQNVLHRAPDAEGYQYWTNALQGGASQGSVLLGFSDSLENRIQTADATHNNWVSGVSEDRIPWLIEPVRKPKSIGPKRMNRLGFAGGSGP